MLLPILVSFAALVVSFAALVVSFALLLSWDLSTEPAPALAQVAYLFTFFASARIAASGSPPFDSIVMFIIIVPDAPGSDLGGSFVP